MKQDTETTVEKIMISKMQLLVSVILFFIPVISFFYRIQIDIALIKQNHEAHMETALTKIAELEQRDKTQDDRLEKQNEAIIKLLTLSELKK
jgi:hypothetical protein